MVVLLVSLNKAEDRVSCDLTSRCGPGSLTRLAPYLCEFYSILMSSYDGEQRVIVCQQVVMVSWLLCSFCCKPVQCMQVDQRVHLLWQSACWALVFRLVGVAHATDLFRLVHWLISSSFDVLE